MKARVAEDSDYDAVRELLEGLHRHHQRLRPDIFSPVPPPVARDDYRTLLTSSTARVFVAMGRGGAVSGVVVARIQDAGESSVFLRERMVVVRELMVSPVERGQGLGTALMDAVEEWMRSVGVSRLELNVWDANPGALAFYQARGMRPSYHRLSQRLETTGNQVE